METLHSATTTGNGTVITPPLSYSRHIVILVGSSGISAGKVKVECAAASDYAGTWALIGSEQTLVASTTLAVSFTGIYPNIRARISTTVEGGTLTAYYFGAP